MEKEFDIGGTGKQINGFEEMTFKSGPYEGVSWTYGGMKFADEENEDGSINMNFDYEITSEKQPDDKPVFEQTISNFLLYVMEQQVARGEVVYSGGTDEENKAE